MFLLRKIRTRNSSLSLVMIWKIRY